MFHLLLFQPYLEAFAIASTKSQGKTVTLTELYDIIEDLKEAITQQYSNYFENGQFELRLYMSLEIRVRRFYAKHKDEIDISVINEKITKMITQTRSAIDTLANDIAGLENITNHNLLLLASDKYEPEIVQLIDYYFQSDDQCENGAKLFVNIRS